MIVFQSFYKVDNFRFSDFLCVLSGEIFFSFRINSF